MINAINVGKRQRLLQAFAIGPMVAGMLLACGALTTSANAAELSSSMQPSIFDWLKHKPTTHDKNFRKATFALGTSAIYSQANLLPKTEHFVHPVVATNVIMGDGGNVCTLSGLGHRSTCRANF